MSAPESLPTEKHDMVHILRDCAAEERDRPSNGPLTPAGMDMAAREIEQLLKDKEINTINAATLVRLEKEIERLRALLREIDALDPRCDANEVHHLCRRGLGVDVGGNGG